MDYLTTLRPTPHTLFGCPDWCADFHSERDGLELTHVTYIGSVHCPTVSVDVTHNEFGQVTGLGMVPCDWDAQYDNEDVMRAVVDLERMAADYASAAAFAAAVLRDGVTSPEARAIVAEALGR